MIAGALLSIIMAIEGTHLEVMTTGMIILEIQVFLETIEIGNLDLDSVRPLNSIEQGQIALLTSEVVIIQTIKVQIQPIVVTLGVV